MVKSWEINFPIWYYVWTCHNVVRKTTVEINWIHMIVMKKKMLMTLIENDILLPSQTKLKFLTAFLADCCFCLHFLGLVFVCSFSN